MKDSFFKRKWQGWGLGLVEVFFVMSDNLEVFKGHRQIFLYCHAVMFKSQHTGSIR